VSFGDLTLDRASFVDALAGALPQIGRLVGKTVVVKLGGSALGSHDTTIADVATCHQLGIRVVLVHGGGNAISSWLKRVGIQPRFVNGLRVTDEETLEIVVMTLAGQVNKSLVAELQRKGGRAIGISGLDGALLQARVRDPELGRVGDVETVDLAALRAIVDAGFIPVVAPVALGDDGQPLNVNADTAAAEVASALGAERAIFLTDVPGVLGGDGRLLAELTEAEVADLIAEKVIHGGMIPKVEACLRALDGARSSHIVDGRLPHALIGELFSAGGVGTTITRNALVST
jgi:acetylglutamate kinase